jgi:hypothetical protein
MVIILLVFQNSAFIFVIKNSDNKHLNHFEQGSIPYRNDFQHKNNFIATDLQGFSVLLFFLA